jgi:hypothetical protein
MEKVISTEGLFSLTCFVLSTGWMLAPKARQHIEQSYLSLYRTIEYTGGCHCKAVRFTVEAPSHLVVWKCNCSICEMKQNWHFIVPSAQFQLHEGASEHLSEYTFNTKVAKHKFCKTCGVQAYYHPRYVRLF